MKSILYKIIFFFFIALQLQAQELLPFVENYSKSDYQGDNQVWNVAQGNDDAMYFANNHYLLRYDGVKWEKYTLPNKSIIRSVFSLDNRIYTGSYNEFGYWERREGKMHYTSLSQSKNFFENNFYITRQLFFDGFKNYGLNFNVKKFVPSVSTSFSASYGLNSRDYFNKVGSQMNEYTGTSQTLSLKGDTGFDFPVNFNLGFQYFKNATNENKQTIAFNNSFKYSLITRIKLSEIILPLINFEWARVNQQDYRMLNAEIQINPKKGKFKYSVEGKNLLNLRSFDNFFIDNAQSARFSNQILGRYIAARVQLSIN